MLDELIVAWGTHEDVSRDDILNVYGVSTNREGVSDYRAMLKDAIKTMRDSGEGTQKYKDARQHALNMLAHKEFGWKIGTPAGCAWSWGGFWVGYPLGERQFSAIISDEESTDDSSNNPLIYDPLIAGGLLFTPNYHLTFMLGAVVSRAQEDNKLKWGGMFSIGLQGDLISLFK